MNGASIFLSAVISLAASAPEPEPHSSSPAKELLETSPLPEPPSIYLLAGGLAILGVGVTIDVMTMLAAKDGDTSCYLAYDPRERPRRPQFSGCFFGTLAAPWLEQGGAAAATGYFWKMGEHDRAADDAAEETVHGTRTETAFGIALGVIGFVARSAVAYFTYQLAQCSLGTVPDQECLDRNVPPLMIVGLGSVPVTAVGAALAGYGLGYQTFEPKVTPADGGATASLAFRF